MKREIWSLAIGAVSFLLLQSGCRLDMHDQPRYESFQASDFFADGKASQTPPEGTVAQGQLREDEHLYTGRVNGQEAETLPFPLSLELLLRGRQRYDIYCAPCHDRVGTGQGMIVQRGMRQPPSFHILRLREAPPGYIYNVITHGFGAMYSYASKIPPRDRWAIAAYIQALQLSQQATAELVSAEDLRLLQEKGR